MLPLPAGARAARAGRLAGCRLAHTRVPSFLHSLVYLCHSPGLLRNFCTGTSTRGVSISNKPNQTKQNTGVNAPSSCQRSPSACLPNDFYFMPLWQSHPIRLKYPGLERLSPESFSKGASHRPLNPPHFMVQIFNSSERGSGGERLRKTVTNRAAAPRTTQVPGAISVVLSGFLPRADRKRSKKGFSEAESPGFP